MSLKKLIEEITQPIVEDVGGIVAGDGTIKGGSKLSKIKKMKKKGHTSVPYGSGYKKVNETQKTVTDKVFDKKRKSKEWTIIGHTRKRGKSYFHVRDEKTKKRFDVRLIEQKSKIKKPSVYSVVDFNHFIQVILLHISGCPNKLMKLI